MTDDLEVHDVGIVVFMPAPGVDPRAYAPGGIPKGEFEVPGPGFAPSGYRNAKAAQRDALNFFLNNALTAGPQLQRQVGVLTGQANESRMSDPLRAAFLAPYQENVNTQYDQARDRLTQDLSDRGIDRSSGAGGAYAGLEGQRARTQSGLISDLYRTEDERQRESQESLRQLLFQLMTGGGGEAGTLFPIL